MTSSVAVGASDCANGYGYDPDPDANRYSHSSCLSTSERERARYLHNIKNRGSNEDLFEFLQRDLFISASPHGSPSSTTTRSSHTLRRCAALDSYNELRFDCDGLDDALALSTALPPSDALRLSHEPQSSDRAHKIDPERCKTERRKSLQHTLEDAVTINALNPLQRQMTQLFGAADNGRWTPPKFRLEASDDEKGISFLTPKNDRHRRRSRGRADKIKLPRKQGPQDIGRAKDFKPPKFEGFELDADSDDGTLFLDKYRSWYPASNTSSRETNPNSLSLRNDSNASRTSRTSRKSCKARKKLKRRESANSPKKGKKLRKRREKHNRWHSEKVQLESPNDDDGDDDEGDMVFLNDYDCEPSSEGIDVAALRRKMQPMPTSPWDEVCFLEEKGSQTRKDSVSSTGSRSSIRLRSARSRSRNSNNALGATATDTQPPTSSSRAAKRRSSRGVRVQKKCKKGKKRSRTCDLNPFAVAECMDETDANANASKKRRRRRHQRVQSSVSSQSLMEGAQAQKRRIRMEPISLPSLMEQRLAQTQTRTRQLPDMESSVAPSASTSTSASTSARRRLSEVDTIQALMEDIDELPSGARPRLTMDTQKRPQRRRPSSSRSSTTNTAKKTKRRSSKRPSLDGSRKSRKVKRRQSTTPGLSHKKGRTKKARSVLSATNSTQTPVTPMTPSFGQSLALSDLEREAKPFLSPPPPPGPGMVAGHGMFGKR